MLEENQPLSDAARAKIHTLRRAQRADPRIVMSPAAAEEALGVGGTRIRELMDASELSSVLDGKLRRIFTSSVYDYLVRRIIATNPVDGSPVKVETGFRARRVRKGVAR